MTEHEQRFEGEGQGRDTAPAGTADKAGDPLGTEPRVETFQPSKPWLLPVVAAAALLIGLVGGYFGRPLLDQGPTSGERAAQTPAAAEAEGENTPAQSAPRPTLSAEQEAQRQLVMETLIGETRHFKGSPDAPITILEFSDFQCGYCGSFARETEVKIEDEYIEDGLVRFGYWHFPFLGSGSQLAAEASECAADQEAFWAFHEVLFSGQVERYSAENMKSTAADLGLDTAAFNTCLDSGKHTEAVQKQLNLARQLGVQSTPTFLVNGRPVVGAQPFAAFEGVIDSLLTAE